MYVYKWSEDVKKVLCLMIFLPIIKGEGAYAFDPLHSEDITKEEVKIYWRILHNYWANFNQTCHKSILVWTYGLNFFIQINDHSIHKRGYYQHYIWYNYCFLVNALNTLLMGLFLTEVSDVVHGPCDNFFCFVVFIFILVISFFVAPMYIFYRMQT